mmetsp:Transcript_78294/g.138259  ORF Transcript_78294/g.138259 Transcript_78294/m.138259 type:complete len:242 (-) Transcript_78294:911-1636(-)
MRMWTTAPAVWAASENLDNSDDGLAQGQAGAEGDGAGVVGRQLLVAVGRYPHEGAQSAAEVADVQLPHGGELHCAVMPGHASPSDLDAPCGGLAADHPLPRRERHRLNRPMPHDLVDFIMGDVIDLDVEAGVGRPCRVRVGWDCATGRRGRGSVAGGGLVPLALPGGAFVNVAELPPQPQGTISNTGQHVPELNMRHLAIPCDHLGTLFTSGEAVLQTGTDLGGHHLPHGPSSCIGVEALP